MGYGHRELQKRHGKVAHVAASCCSERESARATSQVSHVQAGQREPAAHPPHAPDRFWSGVRSHPHGLTLPPAPSVHAPDPFGAIAAVLVMLSPKCACLPIRVARLLASGTMLPHRPPCSAFLGASEAKWCSAKDTGMVRGIVCVRCQSLWQRPRRPCELGPPTLEQPSQVRVLTHILR